jgi:hypothetical protein
MSDRFPNLHPFLENLLENVKSAGLPKLLKNFGKRVSSSFGSNLFFYFFVLMPILAASYLDLAACIWGPYHIIPPPP